jgi:hypothetical protein
MQGKRPDVKARELPSSRHSEKNRNTHTFKQTREESAQWATIADDNDDDDECMHQNKTKGTKQQRQQQRRASTAAKWLIPTEFSFYTSDWHFTRWILGLTRRSRACPCLISIGFSFYTKDAVIFVQRSHLQRQRIVKSSEVLNTTPDSHFTRQFYSKTVE